MDTNRDGKSVMADIAQSVSDNTKGAATEFSKKLQENAELVKDKAEAAVEDLKSGSNEALNKLGDKLGKASASIADQAKAHPEYAPEIKTVADGLENTGKYLKKRTVGEVGNDLVGVVREHPLAAAALVVGLGVLIGQAFFRR